ncbi:MAG: Asp23/Gls24 family envelope stress response protein [Lachnospiraceae bacterium]|nr:Asp23/Gls24 family envelope stress response protein [Lachnospiraceae bacterium]
MGKETESKNLYKIKEDTQFGEVQIADDVIAIIAALSATEVEGVAGMSGNITNEIISKLGMKNLSKGVKVKVSDNIVSVDLSLELKFGVSLPEVCENVQEKVKSSIELMTGLSVDEVNVRIAGIALDNE